MSTGTVVSVNTSSETGTAKRPAASISLDRNGIVGDAHAGPWHRQVSLLAQESVDAFSAQHNRTVHPGEFAENITTQGLDLEAACPLDRLQAGEVELEVTQIGKACHGEGCAIYREVGTCVMPKEGIFARVIAGGTLEPGDTLCLTPRPLRARVITLSDRAADGAYEDRSGPALLEALCSHFAGSRWHLDCSRTVLPDDAAALEEALQAARAAGVDLIFTTGSTGVGPRDIAPEVVRAACERELPGIMECIRVKFGLENRKARLSRSVAGTAGTTQIYALPGNPRAVAEYMGEILPTVEHCIRMLHGIDAH